MGASPAGVVEATDNGQPRDLRVFLTMRSAAADRTGVVAAAAGIGGRIRSEVRHKPRTKSAFSDR